MNKASLDRLVADLADSARPEGRHHGDPAAAARGVLWYLIDRLDGAGTGPPVTPDPGKCPNCDQVVPSTRSPYCCEPCREVAGFVRQFREWLNGGNVDDRDKQVAFGQVLWHVLGGGRPLRRALVPAKGIEQVLKREGGQCQGCGAPATTIDHAGSGCNRTINLRAVCEGCGRDRPFGDPRVMSRSESSELLAQIAERVASIPPLRVCDDAATWDWRGYVADRKLLAELSLRNGPGG